MALGIPVSAQLAEVLIANLDHESGQEYIAVARSRGLRQSKLFLRHLVKPSSLPAVTVLALMVGERRAREIVLLCEEVPAPRAADWGLINRAVPAAELDAVVDGWVEAQVPAPAPSRLACMAAGPSNTSESASSGGTANALDHTT